MSDRVWKLIEVKDIIYVPFKWLDDTPGGENLGRAEFKVCLKLKHNKIRELWVYPMQQRMNTYWHLDHGNGYNDFVISQYGFPKDTESTGVWLAFPCKKHKAISFFVYVPTGAKWLEISPGGLSFWYSDPLKNMTPFLADAGG